MRIGTKGLSNHVAAGSNPEDSIPRAGVRVDDTEGLPPPEPSGVHPQSPGVRFQGANSAAHAPAARHLAGPSR